MPVDDFFGNTFVAFIDISGFKNKLKIGIIDAETDLNSFYSIGYKLLRNNSRIKGFFISDCGILIVDPIDTLPPSQRYYDDLHTLLSVVKEINKSMLEKSIMLTTSIAYGYVQFKNPLEHGAILKIPLLGEGYLNAYLHSESDNPKLEPGQCRILKHKLPVELEQIQKEIIENFPEFRLLSKKNPYYNYYWMAENPEFIDNIKRRYNSANNAKYREIQNLLNNPTE